MGSDENTRPTRCPYCGARPDADAGPTDDRLLTVGYSCGAIVLYTINATGEPQFRKSVSRCATPPASTGIAASLGEPMISGS